MKQVKKTVAIILVAILALTPALAVSAADSSFGAYERVVIIGVDGAGAFFAQADTPRFDGIMSSSAAVTYDARTEHPSISAQCWGSILLGVTEDRHGLDNETLGSVERTSAEKYPSVFRVVREAYPEATLASFCNWNPINFGLIENDLGVYKDTASDDVLTDKIVDYLTANDPKLLFVQFDSVDGAGHENGYGTENYLAQISVIDGYIGRIYDCLNETGKLEDTLFIVTSDHGGTPKGGHGGTTAAEMTIFIGAKGKTVCEGTIGEVEGRDIASITLYALGCEQPEIMTARVPDGLFRDYTAGPRPLGDSSLKQFLDFMALAEEYLPLLMAVVGAILSAVTK